MLAGCSKKLTAKEIYNLNNNSVGKIHTNRSTGSAFVIDKNKGLIITNYHVIKRADEIKYITENSDTYEIEGILFANDELDLAIIKINLELLAEVTIESKQETEIGDKIFVLNSPFGGFVNTLSEGIISSIRNIEHKNYYQHTASISEGSSGGALFNEYGNVIGITNMGVGESNINFAIIIDNEIFSIINRYKAIEINNMMDIKDIANREGDILNGEFTGIVKEYYPSGLLKFEGSIVNGKYNGEGTLYRYDYGQLISYTGSFVDGKYDGYGKEYFNYNDEAYINRENRNFTRYYLSGMLDRDRITDAGWKVIYEYLIDSQQTSYDEINNLNKDFLERCNISYIRPGFTAEGRLKYEGDYKNGLFGGHGKL